MRLQIPRSVGSIRHRLLVALAGLGILFGWAAVQWPSWEEKRSFAAVRLGMTEDEVLAAVGKPPGQYGPAGATYASRLIYT